jgi:ribulose-phosphate 3-epimerase
MNQAVRVVPALLSDDPEALQKMLSQAKQYTDYVQIDIMDGKFVPSKSVTWDQVAALKIEVNWEVHLMVEKPETYFGYYKKAGTQKVIFHFESTSNPEAVIGEARKLNLQVGIAINPETTVSQILPLSDKVDCVLFLSVHPGFYGAKFLPEVVNKIIELRRARPDLKIGIDGGVKETNIAEITGSGVNDIFVGSAILLQPDPGAAYRRLLAIARSVRSEQT